MVKVVSIFDIMNDMSFNNIWFFEYCTLTNEYQKYNFIISFILGYLQGPVV